MGLPLVVNVDATARANHTGTQSADSLIDGTTNKAFLATERTKLAGVATGATANATDATLLNRANHTGTQSADTLVDGTTSVAFLATERAKLAGIAAGASTSITSATNKGAVYATGATTATSTAALTDGQILIGSGAGNPAPASITAGTGITVTNAANAITIAAAATGATPRATLVFPTAGGSGNQISTAGAGTNVFGFAQGAYTHTVTGTGTSSSGGFFRRGTGWAGNAFRNMTGTFSGSISNNAGNGTVYVRFFYTGASGSISADDYTARQIGFVCTGGAVYAQVGNGTTGQSTALTGVNLVGNDVTITVAVIDGVSVKFSVDGTLVATFTTGLPDTTTQRKAVLLEKVEDGNGSGTALAIYGYAISYDA